MHSHACRWTWTCSPMHSCSLAHDRLTKCTTSPNGTSYGTHEKSMEPVRKYMHVHPLIASSCRSTLSFLSLLRQCFHLFCRLKSVALAFLPSTSNLLDPLECLMTSQRSASLLYLRISHFLLCLLLFVTDGLCKVFFFQFECSNKKLLKAFLCILLTGAWTVTQLEWLDHNSPLMQHGAMITLSYYIVYFHNTLTIWSMPASFLLLHFVF